LASDIRTIGRIFLTCRENNQLGSEKELWNILCRRDFGRNGDREAYASCFIYGSHYIATKMITGQYWHHKLGIPLFLSVHKDAMFVFYRNDDSATEMIPCNVLSSSINYKNYKVSGFHKNVISMEDPCIARYFIKPLIEWITKHFSAVNLQINKEHISFFCENHHCKAEYKATLKRDNQIISSKIDLNIEDQIPATRKWKKPEGK
jgi:hypothetical protein